MRKKGAKMEIPYPVQVCSSRFAQNKTESGHLAVFEYQEKQIKPKPVSYSIKMRKRVSIIFFQRLEAD